MQTADSAADVLTQHQRAVLSLLATGLTSAGVGATLRIPVDEVRATARDTIRALGARSKLDAVMIGRTPHAGDEPESDGRPLRDIRAERLLSLRELPLLAGVAPSTVHLIEAGRPKAAPLGDPSAVGGPGRRSEDGHGVSPCVGRTHRLRLQGAGGAFDRVPERPEAPEPEISEGFSS